MLSETNTLTKSVWTEADFEEMVWLDTVVWAMAFFPQNFELALDIDHTVRWIPPHGSSDAVHYDRWTAPATLVFRNVGDLDIDADLILSASIDDVLRRDQGVPRNRDDIEEKVDWQWVLECVTGEIRFRSTGFREYFRRQPVMKNRLALDERGGISFDRTITAAR
jgi:hypothetical protein